jgi:hypothetical protein
MLLAHDASEEAFFKDKKIRLFSSRGAAWEVINYPKTSLIKVHK